MEPLVKTGFVAACHVARLCLSPSFWQGPASLQASGQQNERGTAGQFRADCCPAGISLHVLPACLVDTHKHTEGDLARRPGFFCSLWCICVSWLASSLDLMYGQYKFNHNYPHYSSFIKQQRKKKNFVFHLSGACINYCSRINFLLIKA